MARHIYQGYFQDQSGNVVSGGSATCYLAGTTTAASIYAAASGGAAISGASVTTDSVGYFKFYVEDSDYPITTQYFDVLLSKTNFTSQTIANIKILEDRNGEVPAKWFSSFASALTSLGSSTVTLVIDDTQIVSATVVAASTLTFKFIGSGMLTINDGVTLTINNMQDPPLRKIFNLVGTGVVVLKNGKDIYPNWYATNTTPGTADMTTAFQAALDAAKAVNGSFKMAAERYLVTDTLTYFGVNPGDGIAIRGSGSNPRSGQDGSALVWGGVSSKVVLHLRGANATLLEEFTISVTGSNRYLGAILLEDGNSPQHGSGPGSSGVKLTNLMLAGGVGAGSYGVCLGNTTYQMDSVDLNNVLITGVDASGTTDYGIVIAANNAKNFNIISGGSLRVKYGIYYSEGGSSGYQNIYGMSFGNNTIADIGKIGYGHLNIDGINSEGSARFVDHLGWGGNNNCSIYISNSNWASGYSSGVTGDIIIKGSFNKLTLMNNEFRNMAPGDATYSIPKIVNISIAYMNASPPFGHNGSVVSINNFYMGQTSPYVPIYDSVGDYVWDINSGNAAAAKIRVFSFGDSGTVSSNLNIDAALLPLIPIMGQMPVSNEVMLYGPQAEVAGFTYIGARTKRAVSQVIIDKAVWTAAALTKDYRIFQIPNGYSLQGIYARTTQAYAGTGLTGTIELRVGSTAGGTQYILNHDVKSAAIFAGGADAELGASITRAVAVQGGQVNFTGGGIDIYIRLASSVGNLGNGTVTNLTAGSTIIYVVAERLID